MGSAGEALSFDVSPLNYPNLADLVRTGGHTVFTLNLAHIRMLSSDSEFRKVYNAASVVTLDSRFLNLYFLKGRHVVVTGSDFVRFAAESGALRGLSVLIIGNVAAPRAASILDGCEVKVLTPSFGFSRRPAELTAVIDETLQLDPDIVFVAVGAPQSEHLAQKLRGGGLRRASIVCCGAAFEFMTGQQTRAPGLVSRVGFEWLWRISTDPRRLLMRYLRDAAFVARNGLQFARLDKSRVLSFDGVRISFPRADRHAA